MRPRRSASRSREVSFSLVPIPRPSYSSSAGTTFVGRHHSHEYWHHVRGHPDQDACKGPCLKAVMSAPFSLPPPRPHPSSPMLLLSAETLAASTGTTSADVTESGGDRSSSSTAMVLAYAAAGGASYPANPHFRANLGIVATVLTKNVTVYGCRLCRY